MDAFVELIAKGAAVVGIQVEHLWPQVIAAYWLETLGRLLVGPFLVAVLLIVARRCWQTSQTMKTAQANSYNEGHMGFVVAAGIGWCIAAIIGVVYLFIVPTGVAVLLWPEAMYVRSLVEK